MGRPQKQTVDYFPHDAVPGKTIFILQNRFGNNGYAAWFKLLALLCRTPGHCYYAQKPADWQFLVAEMALTEGETQLILGCLAELDAIDPKLWANRVIWATGLMPRIADAYKDRIVNLPVKPTINPISPPINPVSSSVYPQIKVNETILNKKEIYTKKKYGQFENVLLSDAEYEKLKTRFNRSFQEKIEELSEAIASFGYKYKSHYATILRWHRKHEKETGGQNGTNRQNPRRSTRLPDRNTGYTEPPPDPALAAAVAALYPDGKPAQH